MRDVISFKGKPIHLDIERDIMYAQRLETLEQPVAAGKTRASQDVRGRVKMFPRRGKTKLKTLLKLMGEPVQYAAPFGAARERFPAG